MASYQQNYDANSYQVSPYQLPAQQMVQAIATRNQYWDTGASQIQQAYENYLGLDLSLDKNRSKLDGLMQGINQNLKKVSTMDLSINSNVEDAMKVFSPVADDEDIKYDNAYTKFHQKQLKVAEGFKNIKDGEGYSDTNVAYMNKPYMDWVASNDPSQTKQAYANKRTYTPYHDISKEWNDLEKNFKPDTTDFVQPTVGKDGKPDGSGYLVEQKNKSIYASQLRAYMDAHLSDKAKQQLHINGVVAYGDHLDTLAGDYKNHNTEIIDNAKKRIEELTGNIKGTKSLAEQDAYTDQINQYKSKINELKGVNAKLDIKDYSDLQKNKELVAGSLYASNWVDNLAKSSQHKDITVKYSTDATRLTYFKENMEMSKFNTQLQFTHDENALNRQNQLDKVILESQLKSKGKTKTDANGNPIPDDQIETNPNTKVSDTSDDLNLGQKTIDQLQTDATQLKAKANQLLSATLKDEIPGYDKLSKTAQQSAFDTWAAKNKDSQVLKDYYATFDQAEGKEAAHTAINQAVEDELKSKHGDLYNRVKDEAASVISGGKIRIADISNKRDYGKPSTFSYMNLSKDDIQKIINNTHPDIKLSLDNTNMEAIGKHNVLYIKGKKYELIDGALKDVVSNVYNDKSQLDKARIDIVTKNMNKIQGVEDFTNPEQDELKPLRGRLASLFSTNDKGLEIKDINLLSRDKSGGVYFTLSTDGKISPDQLKDKIKSIGVGGRYDRVTGRFYLPNTEVGGYLQPRVFTDPRLEDMNTQVIYQTPSTGVNVFRTSNIRFNDRNFKFRVTTNDGVPKYEVIDDDSGVVLPGTYANLETAAQTANAFANQPKEYIEQKIKVLGKIPDYKIK